LVGGGGGARGRCACGFGRIVLIGREVHCGGFDISVRCYDGESRDRGYRGDSWWGLSMPRPVVCRSLDLQQI